MNMIGKYLIVAGAGILILGLIVYFFSDKLNWFGRLPGDIRVEKENFRFYFPLATTLLLSAIISIGIYLFNKFYK